jgi:hypothetical protein
MVAKNAADCVHIVVTVWTWMTFLGGESPAPSRSSHQSASTRDSRRDDDATFSGVWAYAGDAAPASSQE